MSPRWMPLLFCAGLAACSAPTEENALNAASVTNASGTNLAEPVSDGSEDVLVPGTDFNAVGEVPCGIKDAIDSSCSAGVKRNVEPDGTSYVEVTKPDGSKRVLFFQGTTSSGADSAEADGSSTYRFKWHREDDWTVISYGPERYRIPDALVVGG